MMCYHTVINDHHIRARVVHHLIAGAQGYSSCNGRYVGSLCAGGHLNVSLSTVAVDLAGYIDEDGHVISVRGAWFRGAGILDKEQRGLLVER